MSKRRFSRFGTSSGLARRRTSIASPSPSSVVARLMVRPSTPPSLGCGSMRVHVRLFAGLRERAGWSQRDVEDVGRVDDVWPALGLGDEPPGLVYAVNKSYVDRSQELSDGDEVALIPPVSGGAFLLSDKSLSVEAVIAEVASVEAGAVLQFIGTTRVHSRGR